MWAILVSVTFRPLRNRRRVNMHKRYILLLLLLIFILLNMFPQIFAVILAPFAKQGQNIIYDITPLWRLSFYHLSIVLLVQFFAIIFGVSGAIIATRSWGREFLPMLNSIASMAQTVPPVAVLALAVPVMGFGFKPAFVALLLYGILPIIRNSLTALQNTSPELLEAAKGQGLKNHQQLFWLELPLAKGAILSGVRTSMIITIGTAALGSTIAAKSLGDPIIAGLTTSNIAYVLQATILVALLAIIMDMLLELLQS